MARAPKKYLDRDRTQVNPAWLEWRDEQAARYKMFARGLYGAGYHDSLWPEDVDKQIPPEGRWIRVLEEPYTVLQQRFRVPVMSVWRARPFTMNQGGVLGRKPQLAQITTPGGDLCLFPHEYEIWDDVTWLVGMEPDVKMHSLGGVPLIDEDQLFYLMKAGVSQHDATMLMLNDLQQNDLVWFEFDPYYVELFGRVGQPLWRAIQLGERERVMTDATKPD